MKHLSPIKKSMPKITWPKIFLIDYTSLSGSWWIVSSKSHENHFDDDIKLGRELIVVVPYRLTTWLDNWLPGINPSDSYSQNRMDPSRFIILNYVTAKMLVYYFLKFLFFIFPHPSSLCFLFYRRKRGICSKRSLGNNFRYFERSSVSFRSFFVRGGVKIFLEFICRNYVNHFRFKPPFWRGFMTFCLQENDKRMLVQVEKKEEESLF